MLYKQKSHRVDGALLTCYFPVNFHLTQLQYLVLAVTGDPHRYRDQVWIYTREECGGGEVGEMECTQTHTDTVCRVAQRNRH